MAKRENKNVTQADFFNLIKKEVSTHKPLANKVSEVLNVSLSSAYCRMQDKYALTFNETVKLCQHFGVSLDALMYGTDGRHYTVVPADLKFKSIENNLIFAQEMFEITELIKKSSKGEMILTGADIPIFHFLAYKELIFFQIYSWYKNVYDYSGKYEDFLKELPVDEIFDLVKKININCTAIPSSEVWTEQTIDSTLKLLKYHNDMKHFSDSKITKLICEQLFCVIETLEEWIKRGNKGNENIPYKFYVNEIDIGNSFIFMKNGEKLSCIMRLFTVNGIHIKEQLFCEEVERWLKSLIKRSSLLSEISEKERFFFFKAQKEKIVNLMNIL